uniref:Uncharacterized protein LOC102809363 n=1 Tax=Saccoglossus kowalevskii TaxID=10224 RepID=A0ABM0MZ42_SACKO|nr:PREDICTED: uncharacterized protein LOC102809363 [Saccoglossus kowalevskii]
MYCETQQLHELSEDITTTCRMEGYIEKLPVGQTKASLIKGWKRRYFRAKEGNLFYYESLVIVDIGTCSVRAGLLPEGDGPITAPQIFFPTICAKNKHDPSKKLYGYEALSPHVRENSTISFPIRNSVKMDRLGLNLEATADILEKVFDELGIDPSRFTVVMVTIEISELKER